MIIVSFAICYFWMIIVSFAICYFWMIIVSFAISNDDFVSQIPTVKGEMMDPVA
jgi:hypothetical protein